MMTEETGPPDSKPPTITPLVDWMSRHGWKSFVALVVIGLLFHAYGVGLLGSSDDVAALARVQFDVTPIPE